MVGYCKYCGSSSGSILEDLNNSLLGTLKEHSIIVDSSNTLGKIILGNNFNIQCEESNKKYIVTFE